MSSDRAQLEAMGFEAPRIDWALKATKSAGLQPAMDHILANSEKPVPSVEDQAAPPSNAAADEDDDEEKAALAEYMRKNGVTDPPSDAVAQSIKCSECGKTFRSADLASFHAERSGHQSFEESAEEIKPLTEEEKKEKLAELRQRLAQKRAAAGKEDEKANKANEALRRKAGQDTGKVKADMEVKEAQKEADRKKREKLEDQKARAAIKAQIEADKKARAEKAAMEKAVRDGNAPAGVTATPDKPAAAIKSSENPETRLQVRLSAGGPPLTKAFPSDNTLIDVAEWIASENLAYDVSTVTFASTFPRMEMARTLKENGLTPSAVLMAS